MDALPILFENGARVKLMRLFLMNPDQVFSETDVERRTRVERRMMRKELVTLTKAGLITRAQVNEEVPARTKKGKPTKKRVPGARLNFACPHVASLRALLAHTSPIKGEDVVSRFRTAGKVKLLLLSGFFIGEESSRVDILLVGDRLKRPVIEKALRVMESEIGKELSYAFFETNDFLYRIGVCDKFVRDILDYPHEKALNRLGEGV